MLSCYSVVFSSANDVDVDADGTSVGARISSTSVKEVTNTRVYEDDEQEQQVMTSPDTYCATHTTNFVTAT